MSRLIKFCLASMVIVAAFAFSGAQEAEAHRRGWYGYYGRPYVSHRAYYPRRAYYSPYYHPRVAYYSAPYYRAAYYGGACWY